MKIYFAPMEGITTYLYRRVHQKYFSGVDQYFTPFLAVSQNHRFKQREKNEFLPEENPVPPVPQILTKSPADFLWGIEALLGYGYREINLNTGCPSATVVTKGKGAGMLAEPDRLDAFFSEVFEKKPEDCCISIKTRIGMEDEAELGKLIDIWNRYPLQEIIVHPRLREDYYGHDPRMDAFRRCVSDCKAPICYNGEIRSCPDHAHFRSIFPEVSAVMIGRGLIANPALAREIKGGEPLRLDELKAFHDEVFDGYTKIMAGERDVLFKMKDLWTYMSRMFREEETVLKRIRRSKDFSGYRTAVENAWAAGLILYPKADRPCA